MMSSYILASADQCVLMATRGRRFPGPSVFHITTEIHQVLDRDAALRVLHSSFVPFLKCISKI